MNVTSTKEPWPCIRKGCNVWTHRKVTVDGVSAHVCRDCANNHTIKAHGDTLALVEDHSRARARREQSDFIQLNLLGLKL